MSLSRLQIAQNKPPPRIYLNNKRSTVPTDLKNGQVFVGSESYGLKPAKTLIAFMENKIPRDRQTDFPGGINESTDWRRNSLRRLVGLWNCGTLHSTFQQRFGGSGDFGSLKKSITFTLPSPPERPQLMFFIAKGRSGSFFIHDYGRIAHVIGAL
jgi:hypothetical protein